MLDTQLSQNAVYDTLLDIKKQKMKRHMNKSLLKNQKQHNEEFHLSKTLLKNPCNILTNETE